MKIRFPRCMKCFHFRDASLILIRYIALISQMEIFWEPKAQQNHDFDKIRFSQWPNLEVQIMEVSY